MWRRGDTLHDHGIFLTESMAFPKKGSGFSWCDQSACDWFCKRPTDFLIVRLCFINTKDSGYIRFVNEQDKLLLARSLCLCEILVSHSNAKMQHLTRKRESNLFPRLGGAKTARCKCESKSDILLYQ